MKKFVFENVLLIKPYVFALLGVFLCAPIAVGIGELFHNTLPAYMVGLTLSFILLFMVLKRLSKTVEISFDTDHIYFNYDDKTLTYLKTDLIGFYSFDYRKQAKSVVSMRFDFTDGRKIDLSDYLAAGKYIPERNRWLEKFMDTAEQELDFTAIRQSRARWFGKLGATWFSRASTNPIL